MSSNETVAIAGHPRRRGRSTVRVWGSKDERIKIKNALKFLHKFGLDSGLDYTCNIKALDVESHAMGPYRKGACGTVNIGPEDLNHDTLEIALAILHEDMHTRDIGNGGTKAITRENEIQAHEKTKSVLVDLWEKTNDVHLKNRIKQELEEEDDYLRILRAGGF